MTLTVVSFREDCGASFTDEEIDRAVGIYWTNAFSFSGGVGQASWICCWIDTFRDPRIIKTLWKILEKPADVK